MKRADALKFIHKAKRVVLKVGTSLLTDESESDGVNRGMVARLRDEILFLKNRGIKVLLVTSGSVGMGRQSLKQTRPQYIQENPSLIRRQALSSIGQSRLMAVYSEYFTRAGIPPAQILVTARDFRDRQAYLNIGHTLNELIRLDYVPIVNENDTVSTDELNYGDNDTLSAACASLFRAELLVLLTSVEGFLMGDKRVDFLPEIDATAMAAAGDPDGPGTGGMRTKLRAAHFCLQGGEALGILSGETERPIQRLFAGEDLGTLIYGGHSRKLPARKRWLLYSQPSGVLYVDPGARRALEDGKSLLPVGVKKCEGNFRERDVVDILDTSGQILGRGIVNYNDEIVRMLNGNSTADNRERGLILPSDELIHSDNLIMEVY